MWSKAKEIKQSKQDQMAKRFKARETELGSQIKWP